MVSFVCLKSHILNRIVIWQVSVRLEGRVLRSVHPSPRLRARQLCWAVAVSLRHQLRRTAVRQRYARAHTCTHRSTDVFGEAAFSTQFLCLFEVKMSGWKTTFCFGGSQTCRSEHVCDAAAVCERRNLQQHGTRQIPLLLPRRLLGGQLSERWEERRDKQHKIISLLLRESAFHILSLRFFVTITFIFQIDFYFFICPFVFIHSLFMSRNNTTKRIVKT